MKITITQEIDLPETDGMLSTAQKDNVMSIMKEAAQRAMSREMRDLVLVGPVCTGEPAGVRRQGAVLYDPVVTDGESFLRSVSRYETWNEHLAAGLLASQKHQSVDGLVEKAETTSPERDYLLDSQELLDNIIADARRALGRSCLSAEEIIRSADREEPEQELAPE